MAKSKKGLLIRYRIGELRYETEFANGPVRVGRSDDMDLRIKDTSLSRLHLIIFFNDSGISCEDQGSSNGSFINGRRLNPREVVNLSASDRLFLGGKDIELQIEAVVKEEEQDPSHNKIQQSIEAQQERLNELNLQFALLTEKKEKLKENLKKYQTAMADAKSEFEKFQVVLEAKRNRLSERFEEQRSQIKANLEQAMAEAESRIASYQSRLGHDKNLLEDLSAKLANVKAELVAVKKQSDEVANEANAFAERIRQEAVDFAQTLRLQAEDEFKKRREELDKQKLDSEKNWQEEVRRRQETLEIDLAKIRKLGEHEVSVMVQMGELEKGRILIEVETQAKEILRLARIEAEQIKNKVQSECEVLRSEVKSQLEVEKLEANQAMDAEFARIRNEARDQANKAAERILSDANNIANEITKKIDEEKLELSSLTQKKRSVRIVFEQLSADVELVKSRLATCTGELAGLEKTIEGNSARLSQLTGELAAKEKQLADVNLQLSDTLTLAKEADHKLGARSSALNSLESEIGRLEQEYNLKKVQKKADIEAWLESERQRVESELKVFNEQAKQSLEAEHRSELRRLYEGKDRIANGLSAFLSKKVSDDFGVYLSGEQKMLDYRSNLQAETKDMLNQLLAEWGIETTGNQIKTSKMIQSKHRFWRDHAVTVGLTVLLLMAVPPVRLGMLDFISGFSRSTNNEKKIREIAAERARRYQPKKQHKLRPSYTESVVYSEGFVELKLDEKKRDEFLALLNDQLFVRRKVSDGNLIKVVSLEGALVKKLSEEAKLIHPDFVKDSLDKMKRIEAEIVIEMHKLLGNEENVREFQRLAAQFYNLNNN